MLSDTSCHVFRYVLETCFNVWVLFHELTHPFPNSTCSNQKVYRFSFGFDDLDLFYQGFKDSNFIFRSRVINFCIVQLKVSLYVNFHRMPQGALIPNTCIFELCTPCTSLV